MMCYRPGQCSGGGRRVEVKDGFGGANGRHMAHLFVGYGRVTIDPDLPGVVWCLPVVSMEELILHLFSLKCPSLNNKSCSHIKYRLKSNWILTQMEIKSAVGYVK